MGHLQSKRRRCLLALLLPLPLLLLLPQVYVLENSDDLEGKVLVLMEIAVADPGSVGKIRIAIAPARTDVQYS
jgi:hypothetical protein